MEKTYDRLQPLTNEQIALIHEKSVEILEKTGFWFNSEKARNIFKKHGFKVDSEIVYITNKDIKKALETVPEVFTIKARNPENDIRVGGENFSFSNNAGAPFIVDFNGGMRTSSSEDFKNFLKLNQQLKPIGYTRELVASSLDIP
ncbi:trimethylamine methyltransferase family protein, partial [Desulfobacula sp.]